jgi:cytoskeletal protein CcmA (bactofilin family)
MASIEKTRAVVEAGETYDGKITPTVQAEIDRPVRIKAGATVQGSIYGATVSVDDGTVDGSIMASEGAELEGASVHGEVGSDGKVTGTGATIHGTVTGQRVRLTDSIVYGNVVASDAILEDCVVIGIVTAERELVAEGSLCYTFKSYGEATLDDLSVVLPQAILEGDVRFESPVTVTGLGELEADGDDAAGDLPTMDEADILEVGDGTYLSLSPRILNLAAVTDRLDTLEGTLQRVVTATSREDIPPATELLATLGVDESQYPDVV